MRSKVNFEISACIIYIYKYEDNFVYKFFTISFSYYRILAKGLFIIITAAKYSYWRFHDLINIYIYIYIKCMYIYVYIYLFIYIYIKYGKENWFLYESILPYILIGTYVTPTFVVLAFDALLLSLYDSKSVNFWVIIKALFPCHIL